MKWGFCYGERRGKWVLGKQLIVVSSALPREVLVQQKFLWLLTEGLASGQSVGQEAKRVLTRPRVAERPQAVTSPCPSFGLTVCC